MTWDISDFQKEINVLKLRVRYLEKELYNSKISDMYLDKGNQNLSTGNHRLFGGVSDLDETDDEITESN